MRRNGVTDLGCDDRLFKTVVKTSFGQRREDPAQLLRGLFPAGVPLPTTRRWSDAPRTAHCQAIHRAHTAHPMRPSIE